ncbi:LysE/ArgO family amino acid transporter [Vibrio mangrovi]|uniref:Arginine exporter protein ArgO n=1 Tax=Vibrio mangrovi TaxID=474394 RepID=A0A1Y6ITB8_9VIBR|nr:LysE/ArgO family amino acid transporter [Vibrio mangrovi]MDW6001912.1 LysE/ArgO family amino acid transporter [Vibrio mangrovi]SMS00060.1 Arginine exporter protein ArgO [Vibrio mangrovi]
MNFWIVLQGFSLGASIIIPIGAQNAYVLNQGIQRQHHYLTASICTILDMIFISVGVFGGGIFFSGHPQLLSIITLGGICFLTIYGCSSLKSALSSQNDDSHLPDTSYNRKTVLLGAMAVSALNPHVYLDTIVVLGSIGGQFQGTERLSFALGSIAASFIWFFSLSVGAARFSHLLSRPGVRRCIDIGVALVMFIAAIQLIRVWI